MRDSTSVELAQEIVPGWNVGNSLEAISGETAWGNPKISRRLIDSVKAAGFNAIQNSFNQTFVTTVRSTGGCNHYRLYWIEYITGSIYRHGLVPFYWDNGYTTNHASGLLNRSTGKQAYPEIIKAIMNVTRPATSVKPPQSNPRPKKQSLLHNFPNPFNPSTNISFFLQSRGYVSLKIFDMLGKEVTTLLAVELPAGSHTQRWDASDVSSGEYVCRLQVNSIVETRKLILLQ